MPLNDPYSIEIYQSARNDMIEIVSTYLSLNGKPSAIKIKKKLNEAIEQISLFPYSGAVVPDIKPEFHRIIIDKYLMFYRIDEDAHMVSIYRILNGKRDLPTYLAHELKKTL